MKSCTSPCSTQPPIPFLPFHFLPVDTFAPAWQAELEKEKPSLKRAILSGNIQVFLFTGVLYGLAQACSLAGPLLLQRIVAGIQCDPIRDIPGVSCEPYNTLY